MVTFRHADATYRIRGFYAADGNSAETGATQGNVWQVRFCPDQEGEWSYNASLRRGQDIVIDENETAGEPVEIANAEGSFRVQPTVQGNSKDFRHRGKLIADGRYFKLTGVDSPWLKVGTNSPENLLAYEDFDGTYRISTETTDGEATAPDVLHRYAPHVSDWKSDDPQWRDGKGKGLIGAINYLSSMGMNVAYFLTLNIDGDGKDVWPYAAPNDFTRFDCSKLDQWEMVFEHMQRRGLALHIVTQETENERLLDDGNTARLRKLYYQELVARFAHHPALIWNLGEENGPADFSPNGQTAEQQRAMASFLKQADPYNHPVLIHTHSTPHGKDEILAPLLGHPELDGLSFQVSQPEAVHSEVQRWLQQAAAAGKTWLISMDEIGPWHTGALPDSLDAEHQELRRDVLWGALLAGAAGVEWYFGAKYPQNDLSCEDWRQRENLWKQTRHALEFFEQHVPYWKMKPITLTSMPTTIHCFADPGSTYVFYVPAENIVAGQDLRMDLGAFRNELFQVRWFDPKHGGPLQTGTVAQVQGANHASLGRPPSSDPKDWVVLNSSIITDARIRVARGPCFHWDISFEQTNNGTRATIRFPQPQ